MIGKITLEVISRRYALSLLSALGLLAAPPALSPSNAGVRAAKAVPERRKVPSIYLSICC
jgi:hypothetical protein